ncbi:MAG: GntR family transcriptional regulator [Spirochaetales bacterium]|nr:GntR family transcriptional regulator [Spirochaetales bacterium]
MAKLPAYTKVYNHLKGMIAKGDYPLGHLLPSEPELEKQFGVSRTTIRRAVELLARAGYVEVKQGRGTLVLDYNINQNISKITSISQTLLKKGYNVRPRKIHMGYVDADKLIANALDIEEGRQVVRLQRVQLADEVPIAIMENYINPDMVQGIDRFDNSFTSLYKLLGDEFDIHLETSIDKITAKVADFMESEMLHISPGAALILMRRVTFAGGIPVTYDHLRIRADKYQFEINTQGIVKDF